MVESRFRSDAAMPVCCTLKPVWIETTGGVEVPTSVLYMSMSLDGYIAGPNDEPDNPGGDGFMRLHEWYGEFSRPSGVVGQFRCM